MQLYLFGEEELAAACEEETESEAAGQVTLSDARPYQIDWRDRTLALWRAGKTRCLGVAATGTGKMFLGCLLARSVIDGALDAHVPGRRRCLLFVTPRTDLVAQAVREANNLLPGVGVEVEQGRDRALGAGGFIAACTPSLAQPRRLRRLGADRVQAVVWDEAHNYGPRHKHLNAVMDFFGPDVRHLALTATPDRGDGVGLGGTWRDVAFEYGIWESVNDGWLVRPYQAYEVSGDVRLDGCPLGQDGDFDANALAARMMEAGPVAAVVKAAVKWSTYSNGREGNRQVLVCAASVECAKLCEVALNEWDRRHGTGRAVSVTSTDDRDRRAVYAAFDRGEVRYLCHYDVLTQGWDSDRPKVMVNGRPTRARWVYAQQAGRLLRPDRGVRAALAAAPDAAARRAIIAGSRKPGAMIVDVAGVDHKLTVNLHSVFHSPGTPRGEVDRARQRAADRDGTPTDPEADFAALRREREQARIASWRGVLVDADLKDTRFADPFDVFSISPGREPLFVGGRRPTEGMMAALLRAGIPAADVNRMSHWRAKKVLAVIRDRKRRGLCTYKQARLLRKYGVDGSAMLFEDATDAINRIAANGWRNPECG